MSRSWATNLADFYSTARETLGAVRREETTEGVKFYRYVQNKAGTALVVGYVVTYKQVATAGAIQYQVTKPATAALELVAGVAISAITDAYYGWILTEGYTAALLANPGTTAQDIVQYSHVKGVNAQWYVASDTVAGKAPAYHSDMVALAAVNATTAAANVAAHIACRVW